MKDRPCFQLKFFSPRFWLLWLGLGLLYLITCLPYCFLLKLGRMLGCLMHKLAVSRRMIAQKNIELCFPEKTEQEKQELVQENFASMGIAFFEMAMSWWWSKKKLAQLVQVEGLQYLQDAQKNQKGIILMAFHFTTLEIGAALLGQLHTIDGMYRQHNNPVFDYIQRKGRERHNRDATAIEREDVRSMLKTLRKGRAIWYAPDQDYGAKQSVFVPFFGVMAATVTATSKFAHLGKADVLLFTQERLKNGTGYRLIVHKPLVAFPSNNEKNDCLRINQLVEQAVKICPEQYLWAHRRFKTRPNGELSLY